MPRWLLQLVILFVVLLAIFWAAFARTSENALSYCEPECPETVEYRAPPPVPAPVAPSPRPERLIFTGGITVRCFILILIAGLAGFGIGRITGGPSAADVTTAITGATTARVTEGTLHGVAVAPALLGALQTAAITAVNKLLPPPRSAGVIALVLAGILFVVFLFVSASLAPEPPHAACGQDGASLCCPHDRSC